MKDMTKFMMVCGECGDPKWIDKECSSCLALELSTAKPKEETALLFRKFGVSDREEVLFKKALSEWGVDSQFNIVIEEMSELTKEICKSKRGFNNRCDFLGEIADVHITINQLPYILSERSTERGQHLYRSPEWFREQINYTLAHKLNKLEGKLGKNNLQGDCSI